MDMCDTVQLILKDKKRECKAIAAVTYTLFWVAVSLPRMARDTYCNMQGRTIHNLERQLQKGKVRYLLGVWKQNNLFIAFF